MTEIVEQRNIIKKLITIGLPIAIQNFVATSLNLIDNIMIGSMGESAIAAVSIANRIFFVLMITLFGVYSGMGIYTAQYWGKKDVTSIRRIMGMAFTVGVSLSIIVTIITLTFTNQFFSLFIKEVNVIEKGIDYISIAAFTYIPMSITFVFSFTSRSVHKTKIPMVTSIVALSINTFLNYLLINGNWGFPQLGVKGAAIATVTARIIELILIIVIIYKSKDHPLAGKIHEFFSYTKDMFRKVIKTAAPVIASEALWSIGMSVYYIAYGSLGESSLAALQVSLTVSDLFWAFLIGMGNATAVILGNEIGKENIKTAYAIAKKLIIIETSIAIGFAFIYSISGIAIAGLFNLTPKTFEITVKCIYVNAIYVPVKMLAFLFIVGILRSGGDTKFCMFLDILPIWLIGIPLAFICALVFKLPIYWCIAIVYSEEILKDIIAVFRFKSKKWINVLTKEAL